MSHSDRKCILVVDDLADNLFLLQTLLEAEGYHVETADDGETALYKLQDSLPDLVLLDVMMPGMNGYEVTGKIRQDNRLANLPIILITAHDSTTLPQGSIANANDFVRKPIDFDELTERIQRLLNNQPAPETRQFSQQLV